MTADEALAAIKRGEPIHVDADEIDRFMALMGSGVSARHVSPSSLGG